MTRISRRTFLKRSAALGAGAVLMVYADGSYRIVMGAENPAYRLRILHTNDHHARIEPVTGGTPAAPIHGGVSRRKRLIETIRASTGKPILLLDAGDVFQGTLYFNRYNGMADLEFYNAMKYEAMTIGNHEFDKGAGPLADFIKAATFPVLSANIVAAAPSPLAGLIKAHTIIEKDGEQIGIFGLTTEDTAILSNPGPGVSFTPAIDAARAQVAALQARGVNKIIALTHIGIDADRALARGVSGISLIIGGHSHTPMGPQVSPASASRPYPELIAAPDGRPVVLVHDWEWGRWLGDIEVSFDASGKVIDVLGRPTEVKASLEADQGFENRIAVFGKPIAELRAARIGEAAVALDGARANVRSKETNLGNLIADAMLEKARPDGAAIAIMNGGGIRTSIPAGPVTVGQVLEVLPFGNTLARVDITGAQVKEALENGVSQVEQGAGRFPQVAGLRFTFDPAQPAGSRVTSVLVNGASGPVSIDPNATYRVVTNNFMLTGGDGYSVFTRGRNPLDLGFILADVVQDFIAARSPVSYATDGRIAQGAGAAVPLPAPAPGPEAPAPAPVPVTLPNTGGALDGLWWLAALGASALGGGAALRRRAALRAEAEAQAERELRA